MWLWRVVLLSRLVLQSVWQTWLVRDRRTPGHPPRLFRLGQGPHREDQSLRGRRKANRQTTSNTRHHRAGVSRGRADSPRRYVLLAPLPSLCSTTCRRSMVRNSRFTSTLCSTCRSDADRAKPPGRASMQASALFSKASTGTRIGLTVRGQFPAPATLFGADSSRATRTPAVVKAQVQPACGLSGRLVHVDHAGLPEVSVGALWTRTAGREVLVRCVRGGACGREEGVGPNGHAARFGVPLRTFHEGGASRRMTPRPIRRTPCRVSTSARRSSVIVSNSSRKSRSRTW